MRDFDRNKTPSSILNSKDQKTHEQEDDFQTKVMTLDNPMYMRHSNSAMLMDPCNIKRDLISYK